MSSRHDFVNDQCRVCPVVTDLLITSALNVSEWVTGSKFSVHSTYMQSSSKLIGTLESVPTYYKPISCIMGKCTSLITYSWVSI